MRKSQTTSFYFYFFTQKNLYFVRKHIWKTQFILLHLHYRFFRWQVSENAATPTLTQIFIGFVDVILRSKIFGNRLGILFDSNELFLLIIYFKQIPTIQGKKILIWAISFIIKSIRKGIEILVKRLFSFSIKVFNMKLLVILFIRKKKHLLGNIFGSPHTINWIYLLPNCFSNYIYLKDIYITLKGIEKRYLFVLVLRILLIRKFLSSTTTFP